MFKILHLLNQTLLDKWIKKFAIHSNYRWKRMICAKDGVEIGQELEAGEEGIWSKHLKGCLVKQELGFQC